MRMSDDVVARFAAVRVSYQQGHIPFRLARFTSSCARETNQSAVRMSLKSVRWKESLTSSSSKNGYHRELLFFPEFEKPSVPDSPAKQVQVFRESHRKWVRCW